MASLLLIGITDNARSVDAPVHAALEHCHKLALRCIEIFGGRTVGTTDAAQQIVAAFSSANTACRAAIVIREKTAALLPAGSSKPEIRIICLQGQEYLDSTAGNLRTDVRTPVAALMTSGTAGYMYIDADTLNALSPDLQRHFQPSVDKLGDGHFYRYQATGSEASATATDIAVSVANDYISCATRPEYLDQQAAAAFSSHPCKPAPMPQEARSTPLGASGGMQLHLYHAGKHISLKNDKLAFTIGRDRGCHLSIAGSNTSRLHAWIYADGGHFILRDQSTNGTFVKIGDMPEIPLHHQEISLHGQGVIGIAGSTQDATTLQIEFQIS